MPKIRDFSTYLLAKRAFFQKQKNLEFYPVPTIPRALEILSQTRTRAHEFDRQMRSSTIRRTDEMDLEIWQREHGSASSWLLSTLRSNTRLTNILKNNDDWADKAIRLALGAFSVKLKFLWSKSRRMEIFERETPVIPENVQISAI